MITKCQIEHWDQNYNVKVFRPYSHLSRDAHTFPPGDRNLQKEKNVVCEGLELKKRRKT